MSVIERRDVVGWFAVGPMESLCAICCPDEGSARARYAPHEIDVIELDRDAVRKHAYRCRVCGRQVGLENSEDTVD